MCIDNGSMVKIDKGEWCKHIQGSKLCVMQRKLQLIRGRLRTWCLEYKKTMGISGMGLKMDKVNSKKIFSPLNKHSNL